jgi:hypothetical protein
MRGPVFFRSSISLFLFLYILILAIVSTVQASVESNFIDLKVVNIDNLTEGALRDIMQGDSPETAVELSSSDFARFRFILKGNFLEFIDDETHLPLLVLNQTLYVRWVKRNALFSLDLVEWKTFADFCTQEMRVLLSIQDGRPFISLQVEMNIPSPK